MKLRLAKKTDIAEMVNIVKKTFSKEDAKSAEKEFYDMFSKSFNKPSYIVAIKDNKIIGIQGFIQSWFDYNTYELFWGAVDPQFQGKGVGKEMVKKAVKIIKSFKEHSKANIIISSVSSPGFLSKCGFKILYKLPENKGFIMGIDL